MSITNFPMSMADVEALAAFCGPKCSQAKFDRLLAKSEEARVWLNKLPMPAEDKQPKEPA